MPRWESDVTAPGLRGFILEASPGEEENLLSAALAALAETFTVTAEPAATLIVTGPPVVLEASMPFVPPVMAAPALLIAALMVSAPPADLPRIASPPAVPVTAAVLIVAGLAWFIWSRWRKR